MPKRGRNVAHEQGTITFLHTMPMVGVISLAWCEMAFEANEGGRGDDGYTCCRNMLSPS